MKYTFVKRIREKRNDEMNNYIKKGYVVTNKNTYVKSDSLKITIDDVSYNYGIRVNGNDVFFYIVKCGCQIYLKIYDIYLLLWYLYFQNDDKNIIEYLKFYEKNSDEVQFIYENETYYVHSLPMINVNKNIKLVDSDIEISLKELFLLIYLIQDKSNYLISLGKNKEYNNGIVRLLRVLLECNKENDLLKSMGWFFDSHKGKYVLKSGDLPHEIKKRMNYLTEYEERIIL